MAGTHHGGVKCINLATNVAASSFAVFKWYIDFSSSGTFSSQYLDPEHLLWHIVFQACNQLSGFVWT